MDLAYQANGSNTSRLRTLEKILGSQIEMSSMSFLDKSISIWCDNSVPTNEHQIWWKTVGLNSIDKIVEESKKIININKHIEAIIVEHISQNANNLVWFILISKDNVVRAFQSEQDVCLHLKELISRHAPL